MDAQMTISKLAKAEAEHKVATRRIDAEWKYANLTREQVAVRLGIDVDKLNYKLDFWREAYQVHVHGKQCQHEYTAWVSDGVPAMAYQAEYIDDYEVEKCLICGHIIEFETVKESYNE